MHGLIQDLEDGYIKRIAFVLPPAASWSLPLYELALLTAARAFDMCIDVELTLVTSEPSPLAVFGEAVSGEVTRLLAQAGALHDELLRMTGAARPGDVRPRDGRLRIRRRQSDCLTRRPSPLRTLTSRKIRSPDLPCKTQNRAARMLRRSVDRSAPRGGPSVISRLVDDG